MNRDIWAKSKVTVNRGIFHSTIEEGVFTQVVQKIFHEYFHRSDLSVHTRLKKNTLEVTGEVVDENVDMDDLSAFLAKRLLKTTGFFGNIKIQTTIKKSG